MTNWYASVDVSADASKIPDGPVEAAKYGWDEIRNLETPIIKVVRVADDGAVTTWWVDTEDGSVDLKSHEEVTHGS